MEWLKKISLFFRRKKLIVLSNKEIAELLDVIDTSCDGDKKVSLFPFNEFATFNDYAIKEIIQKTNIHDIVMIILSIDIELRDKIYNNMSQQESIEIKNTIKNIKYFKDKDVVESQTKICPIIYYLANTGKIIIPQKFKYPDNLDYFLLIFKHPSSFNNISEYVEEFLKFLNEKRYEFGELGILEPDDQ